MNEHLPSETDLQLTASQERRAAELAQLIASTQHSPTYWTRQIIYLRDRVRGLEKDAARYRWLRHGDNDELVLSETDGATFLLRNEDLDDAIDEQLEDAKP